LKKISSQASGQGSFDARENFFTHVIGAMHEKNISSTRRKILFHLDKKYVVKEKKDTHDFIEVSEFADKKNHDDFFQRVPPTGFNRASDPVSSE